MLTFIGLESDVKKLINWQTENIGVDWETDNHGDGKWSVTFLEIETDVEADWLIETANRFGVGQ